MPYYSRSQKVGNPVASVLKSNVKGIPALFGLNPVSNFTGFALESQRGSLKDSPCRLFRPYGTVTWPAGL